MKLDWAFGEGGIWLLSFKQQYKNAFIFALKKKGLAQICSLQNIIGGGGFVWGWGGNFS